MYLFGIRRVASGPAFFVLRSPRSRAFSSLQLRNPGERQNPDVSYGGSRETGVGPTETRCTAQDLISRSWVCQSIASRHSASSARAASRSPDVMGLECHSMTFSMKETPLPLIV